MMRPPCDVLISKGKGSLDFFHGSFPAEVIGTILSREASMEASLLRMVPITSKCQLLRVSLVTQLVKNLSEDPLEMGMATHSSTLPWKIPWTEEPGGL